MTTPLLTIQNLSISFQTNKKYIRAVQDFNLTMNRGDVVGLVGESGSGKSVTAMTLAGLLPPSPNMKIRGEITFNGKPLLDDHRTVTSTTPGISMIFQDPFDSLNPVLSIGKQIGEVFRVQKKMDKKSARQNSLELLRQVNFPQPETTARQYPGQLSGGMCQRVMIAMALAAEPDLLIADEPTTALDVTIQKQILALLHQLYSKSGTSILLITHDLGVVAQFCHRVAIMLNGQLVETGRVRDIFKNPLHPYTRGLIRSIPVPGKKERLIGLPMNDKPIQADAHCRFHSRCQLKKTSCHTIRPDFFEVTPGHWVRCHAIAAAHSTTNKLWTQRVSSLS